jgi:hypothetical protein
MKYAIILLGTILLYAATPAVSMAHHSVFAEYDVNGSITIEGVVTEVWFKSPHIRIFVEVISEDGNKEVWNTHGHNPSILRRNGWARDTLQPGDKVTMSGDPTYNGTPKIFIRTITMEDGTVLENKAGA